MRAIINYQGHMLGSMKAQRLQLDDEGVNGQIMPDGSQLGIPIDLYQPVYSPPDKIYATNLPPRSPMPVSRTATRADVNPVFVPDSGDIIAPYYPMDQIDPFNPPGLSTGPPYVLPGVTNPGVISGPTVPAGQGGQTSVGAPANLPPNPDPLTSAIQGTPIATVTNPPVSTLPPSGALPLMNLDPLTAAVNGVSPITGATTPSTSIPLVTPTVAANPSGTITILGRQIPIIWVVVLGVGGLLLLLFGGKKGR